MVPRLLELKTRPKFISDISNYCDRWCKRCRYIAQCAEYASKNPFALSEIHSEEFVAALQELSSLVRAAVENAVQKEGNDAVATLREIKSERESFADESVREQPLFQSASRYSTRTKQWMEDYLLNYLLKKNSALSAPDHDRYEAIVIIQWYEPFIATQLRRAFNPFKFDEPDPEFDTAIIDEINGSVKAGLIAMDRSLIAWRNLQHLLPEKAASIKPIIARLEKLRRRTEQAFPQARDFIRPGFDEVVDFVM